MRTCVEVLLVSITARLVANQLSYMVPSLSKGSLLVDLESSSRIAAEPTVAILQKVVTILQEATSSAMAQLPDLRVGPVSSIQSSNGLRLCCNGEFRQPHVKKLTSLIIIPRASMYADMRAIHVCV